MQRKTQGFTLVEILIVVIILGILAAIVIPQFTEASNDARTSALISDLQTVRSQLELYKVQHNAYPDGNDADNFVSQLTSRTDADGTINASGAYGPYLQKFPANPFVSGDAARTVGFGAADGTNGWIWSATTKKFSPGDADHAGL